jgi:hypothetical protein
MSISSFAIKAAIEAIYGTFGAVVNQECPAIALFEFLQMQELTGELRVPRLMFTIFNGGKALGSKVKFAKFYLIMDF